MALANKVFPVPGGPNIKTPFQGLRIPVKYSGIKRGKSTASYKISLAVSRSAISSKVISGYYNNISFSIISIK